MPSHQNVLVGGAVKVGKKTVKTVTLHAVEGGYVGGARGKFVDVGAMAEQGLITKQRADHLIELGERRVLYIPNDGPVYKERQETGRVRRERA